MWPGAAPRKDAMAIGKEVYEAGPDEVSYVLDSGGSEFDVSKPEGTAPKASGDQLVDEPADPSGASQTFQKLTQVSDQRSSQKRAFATAVKQLETPAQRLSRLMGELVSIENETKEVASSWKVERPPSDEAPVDYATKPFKQFLGYEPEEFFADVNRLKTTLITMAENPSWEQGLVGSEGDDLRGMQQEFSRLMEVLSEQEKRQHETSKGGLTFELYGSKQSTSSVLNQQRIVEIEKRLATLEEGLGLPKTSHLDLPYPDLYAGLKDVAQKLVLLDSAKVAAVAKRVAELTTEIDNFVSKKRAKMGWESSIEGEMPSSYQSSEEMQVAELYDLCHKWRHASASLPWVVHRLKLLQWIHLEAGTVTSRVADLEKKQSELVVMIAEEKQRITELRSAVMQHVEWSRKIVEDSVKKSSNDK